MDKDLKCKYCNRLATQEIEIVVDIDSDHDIDPETGQEIWYSKPIYEKVWVCDEHIDVETEGDIRIGEE